LFWIKDGEALTPPLSEHILASITRRVVIDVSGARERECTLADLQEADEVFLASTVREVQPVIAVDDQRYDGDAPVTARIAEQVASRIKSELDAS